jgi:D-alanine-D-alanine ligase
MQASKILVLGGGNSSEREVSLRSAAAVTSALEKNDYQVTLCDPEVVSQEELLETARNFDVVFPALHGAGGEDGFLQKLFEAEGIACVGADSMASEICFDKVGYKEKIKELDITTPESEVVSKETIWQSPLVARPFVLKPYDGGSSVDTFIVRDTSLADKETIEKALSRYSSMLLEELIEGTEITVGIVADKPLPVIEIVPPADEEFDYENKYNGKTSELCPPLHVEEEVQKEAQALALRIHQELDIDDLSRTDMIIRKTDNKLFVLETNTLPGLTDQSLVPKAAAVAGISMPELCTQLVESAFTRQR